MENAQRNPNHMINSHSLMQASAFVESLKACAKKKDLYTGNRLHGEIVKKGLLEKNPYVATTLIHMYAKCGALSKAQQVLEEIHDRDVVCWNALISGYANHGQGQEALICFHRMQGEGLSPDAITFTCVLKCCGSIRAIGKGKQIHEEIVSKRLLEKNVVLGNALIDMYAKCGILGKAHQVLEELPVRNVVSWSSLIAGYVQIGQAPKALDCFERMQREGIHPNEFTYTCVLKAYATIGSINKGETIHQEIVDKGFLKKSIMLGNAMVDMYARCGQLQSAQEVLNGLRVRDVVSWSALIAGYAREGQGHEAINMYERMRREGFSPDEVTFTCILKACGNVGAIDRGKEVHDEILNLGLLEKNIVLGNALLDMYAKCGALEKARELLEDLPSRNVVSWSSVIAGYAQEGQGNEALICFSRMQREGLAPDNVTFLCILNACSHSGKLDVAQTYYENMSRKYGISPKVEHHTCMVAVFGCAGCFGKAMSVIKMMPSSNNPSVWLALLEACRKWGNVKLGRLAFDHAIQIDHNLSTAYILMCKIYAAAGMKKDAKMVEIMRVNRKGS